MALALASLSTRVSLPAFADLSSGKSSDKPSVQAVAFDAFAVFDPRPVFRSCEEVFPGRGSEVADLWRAKQFDYQWLRALGGQYADFWQVTQEALEFAAHSLKLDLSGSQRDLLMRGYLQLKAWPDVSKAIAELRRRGMRVALLSNATTPILDAGVRNSGLDGMFHEIISTDRIKSFKPDPRAYQLGADVLALPKREILFVASAGWDAAGAKWFGYPTFWNNRLGAPAEQLSATPDGVGATLQEMMSLLS